MQLQTICPYPGLRSFTEEESLYFKGRDQQIDQITSLLEQKKFLMVTGASGEGKSSLIYAGLVPNARAGFFKAKYSNWVVADFRPERSPVKNMALALADKFDLPPATVETELRRGYSSLIDLYTNSSFYADEEDESWNSLSADEQKQKKRQSANLLILLDQFEEFFTNPENFYNEAPSQDAQIVVNLVLETARIALKRNLPVYIVCTMRSDYIGQCSAFRGLPEYIGFSQFFVPRLKRRDLKLVIEEPAILSGNRITQRLIERLVYDLAEGIDQLPILQHALSQTWLSADYGRQEMDLIHYAMVGGMPANELPDEDQRRFSTWLGSIPEYKKTYFTNTGLQKIIEIHANSLYESAWDHYQSHNPSKSITRQETKRIIALAFACLTKIDHSRAVRNRMSLAEITAIINLPNIDATTVGQVLNIYREEENAFVRPFKTEDPETHSLSPDSVLDITHESLIRNWNKLIQWANKEFEYYTTWLDFRKQMDRWTGSGKDSGYLLPIGPLTYFENWYNQSKPNTGWIKRYEEVTDEPEKAENHASALLANTRDFLKQSASGVRFTRAFMKYGPKRIGVGLAILFMLGLSGFYWYDAGQKQNQRVIAKVRAQSAELLKSEEVDLQNKALYLLSNERYSPGSLMPHLRSLGSKDGLNNAVEIYKQLIKLDKKQDFGLKTGLTDLIDSLYVQVRQAEGDYYYLISKLNEFTLLLSYDQYYRPDDHLTAKLTRATGYGHELISKFFNQPELASPTTGTELNCSLQNWLTFGEAGEEKIRSLLTLVSPFENDKAGVVFNAFYAKGNYETNGRITNDYNGGYHTLASLYAALGNDDGVLSCFEFLRQTGQNDYFTGSLFNNYTHILGIFHQFGHRDKAAKMISWLGQHYPTNTPLTIHRNAVIRSGYISHLYRVNIEKAVLRSYRGYFFPNLCLSRRDVFESLNQDYMTLIQQVKNPNERNYLLSLNYKRVAMFTDKLAFDRGIPADTARLNEWLGKSVSHFRAIPSEYLQETVSSVVPYFGDGVRTRQISRKQLLIYPDYMDGWFSWTFHTDLFFKYLLKNNLLSEYYPTAQDLNSIHLWLAKAYEIKPGNFNVPYDNNYPLPDEVLEAIRVFVEKHPQGGQFDGNQLYLILVNRAFSRSDTLNGMKYYSLLNPSTFSLSSNRYEYLEKTFFLNQMKELTTYLADLERMQEATEMAERFEDNNQKALAYMFISERLFKGANPQAFVCLDSVFSKMNEIDFSLFNGPVVDVRYRLVRLLGRIGSDRINQKAREIMRQLPEGPKTLALNLLILGVSREGNFYRALTSIPGRLTEAEDLACRTLIVKEAATNTESPEQSKIWASLDKWFDYYSNYVFYIPN